MDLLAKVLVISLLTSGEVIAESSLSDVHLTPCCNQTVGANASAKVVASNPSAQFSPLSISWKLNGVLVAVANFFEDSIQYYVPDSQYKDRVNVSGSKANNWKINVTSVLTLMNLRTNDNLVSVVLYNMTKSASLNVKECPSILPHQVQVTAASFTYGSPGIFSCARNSELFYANGTLVTSRSAQTQCLADATWSQQENLECWNAPTVKLYPNNISGNEGNKISLFCQAFSGFPTSYSYEFVLPGTKASKLSSNISITLKRDWNQQEVHCKAVNNYTAMNDEGISSPKKMNVQYDPYTNEQPSDCIFYVSGNSPLCEVKFYSNPPTDVYNLTKAGMIVTTDKQNIQQSSNGMHTFIFSKSKVSKSDAGLYTLSVESGLNPRNVDKHLVVNFAVLVEQAPPVPQTNIALIAGASVGGVIALILIIVLVAIVLKKRNHDKKEGTPDANVLPPAVVYVNVPGTNTEQDHNIDDQAGPNQQVVPVTYENVHQYATVGPKNQDGDDDPYIDFNN